LWSIAWSGGEDESPSNAAFSDWLGGSCALGDCWVVALFSDWLVLGSCAKGDCWVVAFSDWLVGSGALADCWLGGCAFDEERCALGDWAVVRWMKRLLVLDRVNVCLAIL
jgi:hypothetical protein